MSNETAELLLLARLSAACALLGLIIVLTVKLVELYRSLRGPHD